MLSEHTLTALPQGMFQYYFGTVSAFLFLSNPKTNLVAVLGLLKFTLWPRVFFSRYNFHSKKFFRLVTKSDLFFFSILSISFLMHALSGLNWFHNNQTASTWKHVMMTYFTFLYCIVFAGQLRIPSNDLIVLGNCLMETELAFLKEGLMFNKFWKTYINFSCLKAQLKPESGTASYSPCYLRIRRLLH